MADISIIVPVFNVERYLEKCIDSLISQTYKSIKIILINDGSPDNSQKIIDQYVSKYPEKVFSYIKENGGLGDARNFGLQYADTEYVAFVDSDDYVSETYIEKMLEKAKKTGADLVLCGYYKTFADGKLQPVFNLSQAHSVSEDPTVLFQTHAAWNKLCKVSLLKDNGILYPTGIWYEDLLPGLQLVANAKHIETVEEPLYYYLIREGSISNSFNKKIFDYYKIAKDVYSNFHSIYPAETEFVLIRELAINLPRVLTRYASPFKEINKSFRELKKFYPHWPSNKYIHSKLKLTDQIRLLFVRFHLYFLLYALIYLKQRFLGQKSI